MHFRVDSAKRFQAAAWLLAVLLLAAAMPPTAWAAGPEVGMGMRQPWVLGVSDEWPQVQYSLDVLQLFIDQVAAASQSELRRLVETCEFHDIDLVIELGGLVDWRASAGAQSAELSFQDELAKVKPLTDPISEGGAGGVLAYINMDGPIRRMLYPTGVEESYHTVETATDELVECMQLWKQAYPDMEINLLTNFPNWGWKGGPAYNNFGYAPGPEGWGDYHAALETLLPKVAAAGLEFRAIVADNPYDYALGEHVSNQTPVITGVDWIARILDLEAYAASKNIAFTLIANSERAGKEISGSGPLFKTESLAFADAYAAAGGTPDTWHFESWYHHPLEWTPETQDGTMTNLLLAALTAIHGAPAAGDADADGLANGDEGSADPDADGLPNYRDPDRDGDGMDDAYEYTHGLALDEDDAGIDSDGDGASNLTEFEAGTNPKDADQDSDELPDGWELEYFDGLAQDGGNDFDGDGDTNAVELLNGTDPSDPNSKAPAAPALSWNLGGAVLLTGVLGLGAGALTRQAGGAQ